MIQKEDPARHDEQAGSNRGAFKRDPELRLEHIKRIGSIPISRSHALQNT